MSSYRDIEEMKRYVDIYVDMCMCTIDVCVCIKALENPNMLDISFSAQRGENLEISMFVI